MAEGALPLVFMAVMGMSLLLYVILDGYDLGIGMLLPLASAAEKDIMIAAIGPFFPGRPRAGAVVVVFAGNSDADRLDLARSVVRFPRESRRAAETALE
jgi:hypothetical protein